MANNDVGGMTGGSLPDWLADWLLTQQGGIPQPSGLESITDVQENPYLGLFSGASIGDDVLQGGEDGDGWSPTFDQLNSNQLTTAGLQDVGLEALKGAISYIPGAEFVNPAIEYGGKAYDYFTDPSGPSSIEDLGSSLKDGVMSLYNDAASEINSFMDNPVDTIGGALGFDMNSYEETNPFANVGETSKNVGTGLGLTGMLTGPVGLAGEAVAGMFETGDLNDVLSTMNAKELNIFDQGWAAFTGDTLRDEAMESFHEAVRSGAIDNSEYANTPQYDAFGDDLVGKHIDASWNLQNPISEIGKDPGMFDLTNAEFIQKDNLLTNKAGQRVSKYANGLPAEFNTIKNPNAEGYDPRIQSITTIEQAHQYWNTQKAIKAEEAKKAAAAAAARASVASQRGWNGRSYSGSGDPFGSNNRSTSTGDGGGGQSYSGPSGAGGGFDAGYT